MRNLMISIAIGGAALAATAAPAQGWRLQRPVQREIQRDINQLANQIQRATTRRAISRREAISLRRDALNVQQLYNRSARNGLDRREVAMLELQVNRVRLRLRLERRDWDGRPG